MSVEAIIHRLRWRVIWRAGCCDREPDDVDARARLFEAQTCLCESQQAAGLEQDTFDETGRPVGYSLLDWMRWAGVPPEGDAWAQPRIEGKPVPVHPDPRFHVAEQ